MIQEVQSRSLELCMLCCNAGDYCIYSSTSTPCSSNLALARSLASSPVLGSTQDSKRVSTMLRWPQKIRTMQSGLETTEHAVDFLARLVGSMANDKVVSSIYWKCGKDLLATTRSGVDGVVVLEVLDDLTRVLLRLVGGFGVGNIGLGVSCVSRPILDASCRSMYLVATDDIAWVLVGGHVDKKSMQRMGLNAVDCGRGC